MKAAVQKSLKLYIYSFNLNKVTGNKHKKVKQMNFGMPSQRKIAMN